MSKLTVLDRTGDSAPVTWASDVDLADPAQAIVVAQAEAILREAFAKNSAVFGIAADGTETRLTGPDQFDQTLEEILVVPQFQGG